MIRKSTLIYITIHIGIMNASLAQEVRLNQIYDKIKAKHTINLNSVEMCELIIWNGMPYSLDSIENELQGIKLSDFQFTLLVNL